MNNTIAEELRRWATTAEIQSLPKSEEPIKLLRDAADEITRLESSTNKHLFQCGEFTSHSGLKLDWKIDCDALSPEDWDCIAAEVAKRLSFRYVTPVLEGGRAFSWALCRYTNPKSPNQLLVDDVLTTGRSMTEHRDKLDPKDGEVVGVVLFARRPVVESWIHPVFQLSPDFMSIV